MRTSPITAVLLLAMPLLGTTRGAAEERAPQCKDGDIITVTSTIRRARVLSERDHAWVLDIKPSQCGVDSIYTKEEPPAACTASRQVVAKGRLGFLWSASLSDVTSLDCSSIAAPKAAKADERERLSRPNAAQADKACSDLLAAYASNTERDFADELPRWIYMCGHHPMKPRCDDTVNTIRAIRGDVAPIKCVP